MRYPAMISKEGKRTSAVFRFRDGTESATFAEPGEDIAQLAREALEGQLEAYLVAGKVPPQPPKRAAGRALWVDVSPLLATRVSLRLAREAAGLTQAQLAKLAGVSQQAIAKLEHPDANPTLKTLQSVAQALGATLRVSIEAVADPAPGRH